MIYSKERCHEILESEISVECKSALATCQFCDFIHVFGGKLLHTHQYSRICDTM